MNSILSYNILVVHVNFQFLFNFKKDMKDLEYNFFHISFLADRKVVKTISKALISFINYNINIIKGSFCSVLRNFSISFIFFNKN